VLGHHILDLILLALIVLFAVSGYRQGFIVALLSFAGFVGGGVLGMVIAPPIARAVVSGSTQQALLAIVTVFVCATIGQLAASSIGSALRSRVSWDSERSVGAVGGAFVSVLALLIIAWFIGSAVQDSPLAALRTQVQSSTILGGVDTVMPDEAQTWLSSFRTFVAKTDFPQVFDGLGGESPVDVAPPDNAVLNTAELRIAQQSIVKVEGTAPSCDHEIEGSGFVYAPDHVMTNAHVVAGVQGGPHVFTIKGEEFNARVVLYDPERDVAVLDVPGLDLRELKFDGTAERGDSAIIAGYPKDQPFTARAARIRTLQDARGPDIYHAAQVTRTIYALRGIVQSGNSGGPLLSPGGEVDGVVFAAALDDPDTGYALTAGEVSSDARLGATASAPVSTGACAG
jgi:S1-C subfamily serine protease